MPDLPELYDALDSATIYLLRIASEEKPNVDSLSTQSQFVSALCAAIEVKQPQELHGVPESGLFGMEKAALELYNLAAIIKGIVEEKETTTETQEEA